jgi:hypothetical protein
MILLNRDIRLLRLPVLVIDKSAFVLTFLVALACFNRPSRLLLLHGRRLYAASALAGLNLLAGPTMRHQPGCCYCLAITATGFPRYTH